MPINPITKWSTGERFNVDVANRPFDEMATNNQEVISQNPELKTRLSLKPLYDFRFDENRYFSGGSEFDLSTLFGASISTNTSMCVRKPNGTYTPCVTGGGMFPYHDEVSGYYAMQNVTQYVGDTCNPNNTGQTPSNVTCTEATNEPQIIDGYYPYECVPTTAQSTNHTIYGSVSFSMTDNTSYRHKLILKPNGVNYLLVYINPSHSYKIDLVNNECYSLNGCTQEGFKEIIDGYYEIDVTFTTDVGENATSSGGISNLVDKNGSVYNTPNDTDSYFIAYNGFTNLTHIDVPIINNTGATITSGSSFINYTTLDNVLGQTDFTVLCEYYKPAFDINIAGNEISHVLSLRNSINAATSVTQCVGKLVNVNSTNTISTDLPVNEGSLTSTCLVLSGSHQTYVQNGVVELDNVPQPKTLEAPMDGIKIGWNLGGYIKRITLFDKPLTTDAAIALTKGSE